MKFVSSSIPSGPYRSRFAPDDFRPSPLCKPVPSFPNAKGEVHGLIRKTLHRNRPMILKLRPVDLIELEPQNIRHTSHRGTFVDLRVTRRLPGTKPIIERTTGTC